MLNVYEIQWIPILFYVSENYYCFQDIMLVDNDIFSEEANLITSVGKYLKMPQTFSWFFCALYNKTLWTIKEMPDTKNVELLSK